MGKIEFFSINKPQKAYSFIVLACLLFTLTLTSTIQKAHGMGRISHHTPNKLPSRWQNRAYNHLYKSNHQLAKSRTTFDIERPLDVFDLRPLAMTRHTEGEKPERTMPMFTTSRAEKKGRREAKGEMPTCSGKR